MRLSGCGCGAQPASVLNGLQRLPRPGFGVDVDIASLNPVMCFRFVREFGPEIDSSSVQGRKEVIWFRV